MWQSIVFLQPLLYPLTFLFIALTLTPIQYYPSLCIPVSGYYTEITFSHYHHTPSNASDNLSRGFPSFPVPSSLVVTIYLVMGHIFIRCIQLVTLYGRSCDLQAVPLFLGITILGGSQLMQRTVPAKIWISVDALFCCNSDLFPVITTGVSLNSVFL
jgi:hypothetical protein